MTDMYDFTACRLFDGFSSTEFLEFYKYFRHRTIREGAAVFLENMPGESLYVVVSGTIRISKMLGEGEERTLVLLGPDDYFGEMALQDISPRSATARVVEEASLLSLRRSDFENFSEVYPKSALKLIHNIMKDFCLRIRGCDQGVRDLLLMDKA